jgi:hypothetical protein
MIKFMTSQTKKKGSTNNLSKLMEQSSKVASNIFLSKLMAQGSKVAYICKFFRKRNWQIYKEQEFFNG